MTYRILIPLLALAGMTTLSAQTAAKPAAPVVKPGTFSVVDPRDYVITKTQLAVREAQLANMLSGQAAEDARQKNEAGDAMIASARKQLGLDDSWQWDFQKNNFVQVAPPATTRPAPAPAAAKK